MTSAPRPGHARVRFDELAWAHDLAAATPAARAAAQRARAQLERDGAPVQALRACDPEAPDGTRLPGCVKLYVPVPAGPWGLVLRLARDSHGLFLVVLAFGLRHPRLPAVARASTSSRIAASAALEPRAKKVRPHPPVLVLAMPGPSQLRMPGADGSVRADDRGYVTKRRGAPARNVTSLEMTLQERALLRALADADGIAMSEVLRRGLRLYAAQHDGITAADTTTEVRPAA